LVTPAKHRTSNPAKWIVASVITLSLIAWFGYQNFESQRKWRAFVSTLESQQGLAVTRATYAGKESITITGLRDPDSAPPQRVARAFGYENVDWQLKSYLSLEPGVILQRARRLMNPPSRRRSDCAFRTRKPRVASVNSSFAGAGGQCH